MDHPFFFTWSAQNAVKPIKPIEPIELTGGDGAWRTTSDGGRWLDLGLRSCQVNAGHGKIRIGEAIKRQADQLCRSTAHAVVPATDELVRGMRSVGDAAVGAFGGRA